MNNVKQYRKKPVVIEAIQFTDATKQEAFAFVTCKKEPSFDNNSPTLIIHTLEGEMKASIGDYIIKGVEGEFYPCKPHIFEKLYYEESPINYDDHPMGRGGTL